MILMSGVFSKPDKPEIPDPSKGQEAAEAARRRAARGGSSQDTILTSQNNFEKTGIPKKTILGG